MTNVFAVMLHRRVRLVNKTPLPLPPAPGASHLVIGSVGFVGKINGAVFLVFPEIFSKHAASHMLGMSEGEVECEGPDVVKDVIGELTNMTVGGFKNTLADLGFPCRLTLPVIMRGHHVSVSASRSAQRQIFHFESEGHRISADIQMLPD